MGILTDKIKALDRLEEEYKRERERIEQAIADTVCSIGQNPAIEPVGKHMFTIPMSELANAPWSPEFHDWTIQAERLLTVLNKKPVKEWLNFIHELLDKNSANGWSGVTVDRQVLSKKFLRQVVERL
ncbi:MAG: hypothetical protein NC250_09290 [Alistipes senegalensis]|nr:hypothetical protein [Bacteroides cellulosilyticus]MCM1352908.1 hypothetical protein [Alistipes senegalensis]